MLSDKTKDSSAYLWLERRYSPEIADKLVKELQDIAVEESKEGREPGVRNQHGHHDDYSKPVEVLWLCHSHHMERHVLLRAREAS